MKKIYFSIQPNEKNILQQINIIMQRNDLTSKRSCSETTGELSVIRDPKKITLAEKVHCFCLSKWAYLSSILISRVAVLRRYDMSLHSFTQGNNSQL